MEGGEERRKRMKGGEWGWKGGVKREEDEKSEG